MKARALFFEGPGRVALRDVALPEPGPNERVVRGLASAVSQGTELLLYEGAGPEPFDPSLGASGYPTRYGYAWVGALDDGTRVFGLLPHGDAHVVAPSALRALPSDVPAARATLAANLETAITCTWDANVELGARVVVLGGGVVGLLTAWLLARSADVTLVERRAARRAAAEALGLRAAAEAHDADVVIEATGDPRLLDVAIARAASKVVVASFYGKRRHPVDLGDAFHRKRLALVASQVSAIPPALAPRWDYARRFQLVVELLRSPALDALITTVPFADAPALYARLAGAESVHDVAPPCHVFEYA